MLYKLSDPRYNTMMMHLKMLVREMQQDPLYKVDTYHGIGQRIGCKEVVRVGIRGKVYMKDKYLPAIAEKLGALLEKHHWKFAGSIQRLCGIDYYIVPDWGFWAQEDREP